MQVVHISSLVTHHYPLVIGNRQLPGIFEAMTALQRSYLMEGKTPSSHLLMTPPRFTAFRESPSQLVKLIVPKV